jgi:hypothetical protein
LPACAQVLLLLRSELRRLLLGDLLGDLLGRLGGLRRRSFLRRSLALEQDLWLRLEPALAWGGFDLGSGESPSWPGLNRHGGFALASCLGTGLTWVLTRGFVFANACVWPAGLAFLARGLVAARGFIATEGFLFGSEPLLCRAFSLAPFAFATATGFFALFCLALT